MGINKLNIFYIKNDNNDEFEKSDVLESSGINVFKINVVKFKDKIKCKVYWHFIEKNNNKYSNYKSFKNNWDYNINLSNEIKNKINTKYQNEIYKWKLRKKTLLWFINRNNF